MYDCVHRIDVVTVKMAIVSVEIALCAPIFPYGWNAACVPSPLLYLSNLLAMTLSRGSSCSCHGKM